MTQLEIIGDATLYLGDCREILPTLERVDAVVTDPPYGVGLGSHAGAAEKRRGWLVKGSYASFDDTEANLIAIVVPVIQQALALAARGAVFCADRNICHFPRPTTIGGVYIPAACGRNAWGFSSLAHCLFYGNAPDVHLGAKPTAIRSTAVAEPNDHPCPKPDAWMHWLVSLASRPNESILDPFMGSGTTGVAALKLGRKFIGIEIEPKYFDIACKRIEAAWKQPRLFDEPQVKAKQLDLLSGDA